MSTVFEAMEKRSSTRGYTQEKLTQEELDAILKAGMQAPTATNRQEIHFTVTDGSNPIWAEIEAEKMRLRNGQVGDLNAFYNAPVIVVLSAEDGFHWSDLDAGIAVQNMCLAAEGLGLGSLIVGSVYDAFHGEKADYFKKALAIPENFSFRIGLALGHKATSKEPHTFEAAKQVTIL